LYGAAKLFGREAVFEGVRAVDEDDGDIPAVATAQLKVGVYINLFVGEEFRAA
jgi:hypothetical protein